MKTNIIKQSSRLLCRVGLKIKKHSPEILMVAGVAGTIGSTILACKATLKVNEILEEKESPSDNPQKWSQLIKNNIYRIR